MLFAVFIHENLPLPNLHQLFFSEQLGNNLNLKVPCAFKKQTLSIIDQNKVQSKYLFYYQKCCKSFKCSSSYFHVDLLAVLFFPGAL